MLVVLHVNFCRCNHMVHVLVRILLLELGPLLIHVVIHLQLHKQLMYKITRLQWLLPYRHSTIDCPATPVFAVATATDACGSAFTLTSADVTTNGSCAGSYSITRTWTATDSCGNSSTASQTINVLKRLQWLLPYHSTIDCPATPVFAVATATDACGSAFTLTSADVTTNGSCAGSYSVTRTWLLLIHVVIHLQLHKQLTYKIKRLQWLLLATYLYCPALSICCSNGNRCLFCFHVNFCRYNY
jgi:hypothetical protein